MNGQGSTGNVIAAICSFFAPGLGQLVQGRLLAATIHFILAAVLWIVWMGWLISLFAGPIATFLIVVLPKESPLP